MKKESIIWGVIIVAFIGFLVFTAIVLGQSGPTPTMDVSPGNHYLWSSIIDPAGEDNAHIILSNFVHSVSGAPVRLIFDTDIYVTGSMTIPKNIDVEIAPGKLFYIFSGFVNFATNNFYAESWPILDTNGVVADESLRGKGVFLYRYPDWGPTNKVNIGDGLLDENYVRTNNLISLVTNQLPHLDVDQRDDVTNIINGGTFGTTGTVIRTSTNDYTITFPAPSLISGFMGGGDGVLAHYSNSTTVVISRGDGFNAANYFNITNEIAYTLTNIPSGLDMVYLYINNDGSTYPNDIVITDSTTEPTYNADYAGWYGSSTNRLVGAILSTNNTATIEPFWRDFDNQVYLLQTLMYHDRYLEDQPVWSAAADDTFLDNNIRYTLTDVTPVNSSHVLFLTTLGSREKPAGGASYRWGFAMSPTEATGWEPMPLKETRLFAAHEVGSGGLDIDDVNMHYPGVWGESGLSVGAGVDNVGIKRLFLMPIGPSRELNMAIQTGNDTDINIWIKGWKERR